MEAKLYHFQSKKQANFTLLTFPESEEHYQAKRLIFPSAQRKVIQTSYSVSQLTSVLQDLDPLQDCYLSMSEFYGNHRRTCNFAQTMVAFVDFDTHKTPLGQHEPRKQADLLLSFCEKQSIPLPSLIVFSGRGLHAKWLFERYIPDKALPRWQALEKHLVSSFPPEFGADKAVIDPSRVLRIVGTRNTKNGEFCRVLWANGEIANPARYSFDFLCDEVFPLTREELRQKRLQRVQERLEGQESKIILPDELKHGNLIIHTIQGTWWLRYLDLMLLAEIRTKAGSLEGCRQKILFWAMNALAQSATVARPLQFWNECNSIAQRLGGFNYNSMGELYRRVQAYRQGETYLFNGKPVTPLYQAKTQTMIDSLEITSDEMSHMTTLIDESVVRERTRIRKRLHEQKIYAETKRQNQEKRLNLEYKVRCLNNLGKSIREIARELKIGIKEVRNALIKIKST